MSRVVPKLPNPGTDCDRFLLALQGIAPSILWNANSSLSIMAHSRAADLRKLGWDIVSVRETDLDSPKGVRWGWKLRTPVEMWPAPDGQRPMRVIRKGRVVA